MQDVGQFIKILKNHILYELRKKNKNLRPVKLHQSILILVFRILALHFLSKSCSGGIFRR